MQSNVSPKHRPYSKTALGAMLLISAATAAITIGSSQILLASPEPKRVTRVLLISVDGLHALDLGEVGIRVGRAAEDDRLLEEIAQRRAA